MQTNLKDLSERLRSEYSKSKIIPPDNRLIRMSIGTGVDDKLIKEIKDACETIDSKSSEQFKKLLDVFLEILRDQPCFYQEEPVQKLRYSILECLLRTLPSQGANAEIPVKIIPAIIDLLRKDNEENAVLAAKILTDILKSVANPTHHQNYRLNFERDLRPLLEYLDERTKYFIVYLRFYHELSLHSSLETSRAVRA